jgi:pimeloyl-ACP methyl ester carboxylesterase
VLLHGGGVDSASLSWGGVGPRLAAAGYRVIAPDHPGYGESPCAPWQITQERLVGHVGELVDALGLESYAVGGLSLGGGMTIGHVLDRPQRITGAMLLGSYGIMPRLSDGPTSLPRQMLTWAMLRTGLLGAASRWAGHSPRAMAWTMATLIGDPAQRTEELMAEIVSATERGRGFAAFQSWQRDQVRWNRLRTNYTPRLPSFSVPALIVHGSRDTGVPVAHAAEAAALIPDAELDVVDGARHWVQRDQPDAVVDAMLSFLGRLDWARRPPEQH